MSVLLRQPHGFEGFRMVREELDTERSCPCARCRRAAELQLGSGPGPAPCQMNAHHDAVADVDEVADQFKASASKVPRAARHSRMTASGQRTAPAPANLPAAA